MEIEKKYLVKQIPFDLSNLQHHTIEQGYLNANPVLRIRKLDDTYIFTYKSSGLMCREEFEFPLTEAAYSHLREKCDGNLIRKVRYLIPIPDPNSYGLPDSLSLTIELDIFEGVFHGIVLAEVEFPDKNSALAFQPPIWFGRDVTLEGTFHNSTMSSSDPALYQDFQP